MTKKELAKMIADNVDLPTVLVAEIVQKTFDGIIETLVKEGQSFNIPMEEESKKMTPPEIRVMP